MTDTTPRPGPVPYKRIATEEGWAATGQLDRYRRLVEQGGLDDPAFNAMWRFYLAGTSDRTRHIERCLGDTDDLRLQHMDAAGIDIAVLSLTSPGVQVFGRDDAVAMARDANDELAAAVARRPDRYAGLVAVAPQDPAEAAKEMQRGIRELGLCGVIINSHTHGEYLSDEKFWPIFEAAEALDVPIYLHPNCPPKAMAMPFLEAGLDGAVFGFGVETGLHTLRIITSGVFDRFPKLQLIIGHMGEALPFWLYRLDYMHRATVRSGRYPHLKPLQRGIPEVMRSNVLITNSGVADPLAIQFSQAQLGVDRVLYAMDYPYQYEIGEVLALDAMDMPAADKKAFFEDNARRVFRLG
jgi:2,3-dihydroxybenzoate decarboxylase